jgi:4-amino-4-deoxy-L-arabinose transferase-like glycosyltransferase
LRQQANELPLFAKICWLLVTLIAAFLLGIAVTTPPSNWDAMAYHLPRALHWMQNGAVAHFPTDNPRQLEFAPLGSFFAMHLLMLGGSDRLVNLPQWTSMLLTVLSVTLLVDLLAKLRAGANPGVLHRARSLAGVFTVTIPMGMMQSLTPQNDYLTTFWMLAAFAFALAAYLEREQSLHIFGCGLACGLAALTKGTTYVYAAPMIVVGAFWILCQPITLPVKLRKAVCFSSVFFLLNGPHFVRNQALFGSPLRSSAMHVVECNDRITPAVFASNLIRNLALHNNCGIKPITRTLNALTHKLHGWTGLAIHDQGTTMGPARFPDSFIVYEDYASAPVHLLWILAALGLALTRWRQTRPLLVCAGLIVGSFTIFITLLKYQFWHTRFHLAYMVFFAPIVALVFSQRSTSWWRRVAVLLPATAFAYALFCLRYNEARPIFDSRFAGLPREAQYLHTRGADWTPAIQQITQAIVRSGSDSVGLKFGFDAFEYPIWLMLKSRGFTGTINHCYVEGVAGKIPALNPVPAAIIAPVSTPPPAITNLYPRSLVYEPLMVLWRDDKAAAKLTTQQAANR